MFLLQYGNWIRKETLFHLRITHNMKMDLYPPPPEGEIVYAVGGVGMASCESSGVGYGEEYRVYAMVETSTSNSV
jgi:hypothetical protein